MSHWLVWSIWVEKESLLACQREVVKVAFSDGVSIPKPRRKPVVNGCIEIYVVNLYENELKDGLYFSYKVVNVDQYDFIMNVLGCGHRQVCVVRICFAIAEAVYLSRPLVWTIHNMKSTIPVVRRGFMPSTRTLKCNILKCPYFRFFKTRGAVMWKFFYNNWICNIIMSLLTVFC